MGPLLWAGTSFSEGLMHALRIGALFVAAIVISLVFGEMGLRMVFDDVTTTYDNRSYFALKWKKSNVRLNNMGYREREFDRAKQPGVYRIAFIGDSFTFGQGIAENERMSNILEAELRQHRNGVEVLNFGRPGNNTADEVGVLQDHVLPNADPHFVLLQWYVNDVESKRPQADTSVGNTSEVERDRLNELKQVMLNKSVIYFLLADLFHRVRAKAGMNYVEEIITGTTVESGSQKMYKAKMAMVEFLRSCKEKNVPVAVLLVPDLAPLGEGPYPFASIHLKVLEWCGQEGVTCVDLFPVFEPYLRDVAKHETLWVNRFDAHMGVLANRLAATRLLEVFGPVWRGGQPMSPPGG